MVANYRIAYAARTENGEAIDNLQAEVELLCEQGFEPAHGVNHVLEIADHGSGPVVVHHYSQVMIKK